MITEDYVSFDTAKLLKEKGFTANIHGMYDHDGKFCEATFTDVEPYYSCYAPTLQMAMKWLRTEHNIHPSITCDDFKENVFYHIERIFRGGKEHRWYESREYGGVFPTYEEACEAAIKYCLENLV
jgi:hypothetical protein